VEGVQAGFINRDSYGLKKEKADRVIATHDPLNFVHFEESTRDGGLRLSFYHKPQINSTH
jgi:hypothetical protein